MKGQGWDNYSKILRSAAEGDASFEYAAISLMNGPSTLAACSATGAPVPPVTTSML